MVQHLRGRFDALRVLRTLRADRLTEFAEPLVRDSVIHFPLSALHLAPCLTE